ncbi:MAG: AbrB/MazE/SpoVT family DNA-binding domain-containing protein [Thaumarchaeota archaeon]|nr:MAG: AbrB/MazE/SpoVT family DNA-binding domain-containing protein [Nitrososphaerota archaeon]
MTEDPVIDITRVSDKGQVVIPKEIREKLGFKEGTRLIVVATEDAVILQRIEAVAGKIRVRELMERVRSITSKLRFG